MSAANADQPPPQKPEDIAEEQSTWLSRSLSEDPSLVCLRETTLSKAGGLPFCNVVHSQTTSSPSAIDRHALLELIFQHLKAIGFNHTAETLSVESCREFQNSMQPWERTDLRLLTSLAVSHRENAWDIESDANHVFSLESIEEDFFASPYKESTEDIWKEFYDDSLNTILYKPGERPEFTSTDSSQKNNLSNIKYASLRRIIVTNVMAQINGTQSQDQQLFFLALHSITSSDHFLRHLVTLFDADGQEDRLKEGGTLDLMRRGVVNLIKKWTSFHGLFIGRQTLKSIEQFLTRVSEDPQSKKLQPFVSSVLTEILPKVVYGMLLGQVVKKADPPSISDPQALFSPDLSLIDPDSLEVARQITLVYHGVFASIHSLEFVIGLSNRRTTIQTPTLNEFFNFGRKLQCLVLETFLESGDKKVSFGKMIEIAENLLSIFNYDAVKLFTAVLRMSDVQTASGSSESQRKHIEELWEICGGDGCFVQSDGGKASRYEIEVDDKFGKWEHCIPNMGVELQIIPRSVTRLPDFVDGLINWEKRRKFAERISILYRFQNQACVFYPIPQIQKVIQREPRMDFNDLLKRLDILRRQIQMNDSE